MSKVGYVVRRAVVTLALIFVVASTLFLIFRFMPGDYSQVIAQQSSSPSQAAEIRESWGLNDPLYVQYMKYVVNLLSGDMGNSYRLGSPVLEVTLPRIFNSFILVAPAITVAYLIGSFTGGYFAINRGKAVEKYGIIGVTVLGTIPEFFIGIILITVFAGWLNVFPTGGMLSLEVFQGLGQNYSPLDVYTKSDFWWHYTLPFLTILIRYVMFPALVMRTGVLEVVDKDFMYLHRIKGLTERARFKHLVSHASLPVITLFPASMTRSIGGLVLVEVVFNWPGIGSLLVKSVLFRDYPVVQFVFFLVAIWVILGNFFVDLLYGIIDPRISVGGEGG